jgi:outer membrane protein OmpA-like peptidoglycan-associated protein
MRRSWIPCALVVVIGCAKSTPPPAEPEPPPPPEESQEPSSGEAAPAAPASFEMERDLLVLPSPIGFETGSDVIAADAEAGLAHVKAFLERRADVTTLRIEVHASSDTPDAQHLTEARAMAVGRWLIGHGVACERLIAVGFGASKPRMAEDSPEGRAGNRRVEPHVAALRGHALGGMALDGGGQVAGDLCR